MKRVYTVLIVFSLIALGMGTLPLSTRAAGVDDPSLASCCASKELLPPVRLEAGGEYIDVGACIGHSGPHFADLDRDGKLDLLVGDFSGHIHYYRNTTTEEDAAPVYAAGEMLQANGKAIKVSNW